MNIFWNYLHTVTIAHENEPNEPHRQVIFKEDIPLLITELLERLPKKKDYYKAVDMERETCRIDGYNQALSEVEQVIKESG